MSRLGPPPLDRIGSVSRDRWDGMGPALDVNACLLSCRRQAQERSPNQLKAGAPVQQEGAYVSGASAPQCPKVTIDPDPLIRSQHC